MLREFGFGLVTATLLTTAAMAQSSTTSPGTLTFVTKADSSELRSSKFKGIDIYNNNDEKIGDVVDLLFNRSGQIEAVVIGAGGFLGVGEYDVAVPFNQVRWMFEPRARSSATTGSGTTATDIQERMYPDRGLLSATKEQLKAAPAFKFSAR